MTISEKKVQLLPVSDLSSALDIVIRAYSTNPINVAVLGDTTSPKAHKRARELFQFFLKELPGEVVCIKEGHKVIAVMRMAEPGKCQPPKSFGLMFRLLQIAGTRILRILKWASFWGKLDPTERHWHLGPIAVEPELQGKGLGSHLLKYFCERVDEFKDAAYLETDKAINVRLYERFGFSVIHEESLFGVRNWFMWRPARTAIG